MKKFVFSLCTLVIMLFSACTKVTEQIPLPEHPRPDFERALWQNLNGHWSFTFDEAIATKALAENKATSLDQQILVPFPWGSKLSEVEKIGDSSYRFASKETNVENNGDIGWYGREITVPKAWAGKRIFLVVGASDWDTQVWLNGEEVGRHQGGYTPFECELKNVQFGKKQQLMIKADDTSNDAHLYGKQGYGNARGIWQTVYLEARGENYIRSLHFTPNIDNSTVQVDVAFAAPTKANEEFKLTFKTGDQDTFVGKLDGKDRAQFIIPIKNQHLWNLDDPFLYEVTASLGDQDEVNSYFGQRKVGVIQFPGANYNYVAINNKPIYLHPKQNSFSVILTMQTYMY